MRFVIALGLAVAGATMMAPAYAGLYAADACEGLAALALPHTTITMAQPVAAGQFTPPAGRMVLPSYFVRKTAGKPGPRRDSYRPISCPRPPKRKIVWKQERCMNADD